MGLLALAHLLCYLDSNCRGPRTIITYCLSKEMSLEMTAMWPKWLTLSTRKVHRIFGEAFYRVRDLLIHLVNLREESHLRYPDDRKSS